MFYEVKVNENHSSSILKSKTLLVLSFYVLRSCHFNEENDTFVALSVIIYPNNTDWTKKDVGQNFPLGVIHLFVYTHRHCLWRDEKQPKAFSNCFRYTLAFEIIHVSFYIKNCMINDVSQNTRNASKLRNKWQHDLFKTSLAKRYMYLVTQIY